MGWTCVEAVPATLTLARAVIRQAEAFEIDRTVVLVVAQRGVYRNLRQQVALDAKEHLPLVGEQAVLHEIAGLQQNGWQRQLAQDGPYDLAVSGMVRAI